MKVNTDGEQLVNVAGKLVPAWQEPIRIAQAQMQTKAQEASDKAQAEQAADEHRKSEMVATFLFSLGLPKGKEDGEGRIIGQFKFWCGYQRHHQNLYIAIRTNDEQDKLLREYDYLEGLIDRTLIKEVSEPIKADTPIGGRIETVGYNPYGSLVELQAWIADTMDKLSETLESNLRSAASYHNTKSQRPAASDDRIESAFKNMIRQVLYEMHDAGDLS